jgi:hypothetical protein
VCAPLVRVVECEYSFAVFVKLALGGVEWSVLHFNHVPLNGRLCRPRASLSDVCCTLPSGIADICEPVACNLLGFSLACGV